MTFTFLTTTHITERINGADMFDQLLCEALQRRGHTCTIVSQMAGKEFEYNGVKVVQYNQAGRLIKNSDVISARPQHAMRLPLKGKNVVCIQHNTVKEPGFKSHKIAYVSRHLAASIAYPVPSMVLHPINRYKGAAKLTGGKKVALVNCNNNKGGNELLQLATMLPNMQFVGVMGYGKQIKGHLPNIEYREPSLDLPAILHDCGAVVSFSKSEGYPMLVMEAQGLGLPFFGSRIDGHYEVGCSAYYIDLGDLAFMLKQGLTDWPLNTSQPEPDIDGFIQFCAK